MMLLTSVLGGLAAQAAAQAPPDMGQLMLDLEHRRLPEPAFPSVLPKLQSAPGVAPGQDGGVRLLLRGFRFRGNRAVDSATLAGLLQGQLGQELGLAELQAAAAQVTAYYRQQGYLLASAYLPAQELRDGVVELAVLEGSLGKLSLDNESAVDSLVLGQFLADLKEGQPLRGDALERDLLLINGLPGVEVQSTLRPGASVGATDLDIRVLGRQAVGGVISLDDYGNRYSGAWRAGAQVFVNNPLGRGDALSLRSTVSDRHFRYARLAYQAPVAGSGLQLGGAWTTSRYQLGLDFAALGAHGTGQIGSLYALYPLQRSRSANLDLAATLERKRIDDRAEATETASAKAITVWSIDLSGDQADEGGAGSTSWSAGLALGQLQLDPAARERDAASYQSVGRYAKLSLRMSRRQRLDAAAPGWSLLAQGSAQLAGKNLDSSEKFTLGGAQAVRAYPQGEAACDDALLGSLDLIYAAQRDWQVAGFIDAAAGSLAHHMPAAGMARWQRRSGLGLGLTHQRGRGISLVASLAWRTGQRPNSDRERAPRLWTSMQALF